MTLAQFIDRLRTTPRDWKLGPEGQIRIYSPWMVADPFSAAYEPPTVWNICHSLTLAKEMGLDDETRAAIQRAADNLPYCDPEVRQQLLDACGLLFPGDTHPTVQ